MVLCPPALLSNAARHGTGQIVLARAFVPRALVRPAPTLTQDGVSAAAAVLLRMDELEAFREAHGDSSAPERRSDAEAPTLRAAIDRQVPRQGC
eukprot:scaffold111378_cov36-Phaeocystis_antarctica.AAC.1